MRIRLSALLFCLTSAWAASGITTPQQQFGFPLGADYRLTNYTELTAYWKNLASESDRMKLTEIGKTAEGRPQLMAIVSAPENLQSLDKYRGISRRLALAEGVDETAAHALAAEGKSVVWIDGGLHASEVECAQALTEMLYQMVSLNDAETMRFLHDTIILFVQDNPDGQELVANWYMRNPVETKRSTDAVPRLWHKYIGHDNNRDFFICNMPESTNINRVLYREWFPQIMYNHHQTGPAGAVIFMPPFRDPFNYHFDPLIMMELDQVGSAMHSRMEQENKPGAGMRSAATYSTWYNGGLRTTTYFHNMVGLLTEIIGNPTPADLPLVAAQQLPHGDLPFPIAPQKWHLRQSIDYSVTANRAVLDFASRYRETLLFNSWRMGQNSIERGNRDSWTISPKRIEALRLAGADAKPAATRGGGSNGQSEVLPANLYNTVLHDPVMRDPRGYIIPVATQPDLPTTVTFLNALLKNGVAVDRAKAPFTAGGHSYPTGTYVVRSAQAYRPHVLDMFEPQDHPNDFRYPGGPPVPPYDATGYTLAFQMGVQFDRILDGFSLEAERIEDLLPPPDASMSNLPKPAGYLLNHAVNNSFTVVNRLLRANCPVAWVTGSGAIWVPASPAARAILQDGAHTLGVAAEAQTKAPAGALTRLKPVRIALADQYGGSMPSGWIRWLFEQFEFPFQVVYPQELDAGNLNTKFDVIVLPDGLLRKPGTGRGGEGFLARQPKPEEIPAEFRPWLGTITPDKTVGQLREFVNGGGTVVSIGSSTSLASFLGLPLGDALLERTGDGKETPLPPEKFYVPGSLLTAAVDNTQPLAYGMPKQVDVFFDRSPAFALRPDSARLGVQSVAWFSNGKPLHSGWAWGQNYLNGALAVAEVPMGRGTVVLLGPEVTFRGQPHATFKFLFNSVFAGSTLAHDVQNVTGTAQPREVGSLHASSSKGIAHH